MDRYFPCVIFALVTMTVSGAEPTSDAIINSVTRFQTAKLSPASIFVIVDVQIEKDAYVRTEICTRNDGQFTMLWIDPGTRAPIAFIKNGEYLIYDVADNCLISGDGMCPSFTMSANDEEISFGFDFSILNDNAAYAKLNLDLPSFLRSIERQTVLVSNDTETKLEHQSPSGYSSVLWRFSPGLSPKLMNVTITDVETGEMKIRILDLNSIDGRVLRTFPSLTDFPGKLRPAVTVDSTFSSLQFLSQILHAVSGSAALHDPKLRELDILSNVTHWERIEETSNPARGWLRQKFVIETTAE